MKTKLIIFGITGDLSRRKLLPVLTGIVESNEFEDLSIIGVSRREVDVPELITKATDTDTLVDVTSVFSMNLDVADDYVRLKDYVALQDDEQALIYLSVPPTTVADIVDLLGKAGLNTPNVKLLFEKPFGIDLATAEDFVARTGKFFTEAQIYRIDHYAAKEIAQEVIRYRADDTDNTQNWGTDTIASVDVIASEKIGIEGRGTFYEETGAMRDFIQGHLMQVLSLVLMDVPDDATLDTLGERRLKALEQLSVANPETTIRAQYEGYRDEVDNQESMVETFVSVPLISEDENWVNVPLRLTTGKNLDVKRSAIVVTYRDGSVLTFEEGKPKDEEKRIPDAYERVFVEAIRGNKHLFTTSPEVLRAWNIVKPLQDAWANNETLLEFYAPGATIASVLEK